MKPTKKLTLLLFLALSFLIIFGSWKNNIIFTDEILFEEAAYQMQETGNWLIPNLEGKIWLEKPPLYFWLTAIIFKLTNITPFTRRIVTILSAIGTLVITFKLTKSLFSKKTALLSISILTTTPLFLYFTKTANLDIPATFFITATLYFYLKSKTNPKYIYFSALTFGLAILTRSFLALTPIPVIIIDQLFISKQKIPKTTLSLSLTLALALSLPWHLYAWLKHPTIFQQQYLGFNITQHLFEQTPGHQSISLSQFLYKILLRFNPLAILAFLVFIKNKLTDNHKFLLTWIASAIIPLSLAATRQPWYAIQILPPISILTSLSLLRLNQYLTVKLNKTTLEITSIFSLSIFLALPIGVFLSLPKETKVVTILKNFISSTPKNTPLYSLDHDYIPNSTLYNPRQTPTLSLNQIDKPTKPYYLYIDNQAQLNLAKEKLQTCCIHKNFLNQENATILKITPK